MEGIVDLHHDIMFFLIWVVVLVSFFIFEFIIGSNKKNTTLFEKVQLSELLLPTKIQHNTTLEIV
jgi:heme/copper-type cytochrome/quinol oxidase subunit 2